MIGAEPQSNLHSFAVFGEFANVVSHGTRNGCVRRAPAFPPGRLACHHLPMAGA